MRQSGKAARVSRTEYQAATMYREKVVYPKSRRSDTGCTTCLKHLLFAFNFIFFVLACLLVAGGIYILIEKTFISFMFDNNLLTVATWIVIIAGGLTILISIAGCFAARTEHGKLLIAYGVIMVTLFLALIGGAVTAVVLRTQLGEWVAANMENTLKLDYGIDLEEEYHQQITRAWDTGQQQMQCCSVRDQSWYIYRESHWFAEHPGIAGDSKPYVPESCCYHVNDEESLARCQYNSLGPPGSDNGPHNDDLHYRGCYSAGVDWIHRYSAIIMGFGFGGAVFWSLGIIFAFCLLARRRKGV